MNQEKEPQNAAQDETKAAAEEKPEENQPEAAKAEESAKSPEAAENTPEEEKRPEKKKKKEGPSFFQSQKFKHGSTATAFTAIFIVVIVLVNVLVGILSDKFPSINVDVTKTNSNSLSDQAAQIVDKVKTEVDVTICASKEACEQNSVAGGSGGNTDYAQVSRLFSKAAERNSNIKLNYVDLDKNPAFANDYKADNLTVGSVVVKSDKRYRVLTTDDLFPTNYSQDGSSQTTTSNVDSSIASSLNSVTAETMPVAAFDTGHSEQMDPSGYKHLLSNNSFETKDFNLLTDKIPDKTQLLVIGCPTSDLTDAEIDKVDTFLHDKSSTLDRSVLIACAPGEGKLDKLGTYLGQWGLSTDTNSVVEEPTNQQKYFRSPLYIFADTQTALSLGGATNYPSLLTPNACPITIKAQNVGSKSTYALVKSSDSSVIYKTSGNTSSTSQPAAQTVAALSQETISLGDNKTLHANVIVSGSSLLFSNDVLSSSVFGNSSYLTDLSRYATGTGNGSTKITTTQQELYAKDIKITSQQSIVLLGYGVFMILLPLIVMIAGIIVHRKRRAL